MPCFLIFSEDSPEAPWSASLEAPVSSGGSPAHSIGGVQPWAMLSTWKNRSTIVRVKAVKAVLQNLYTLSSLTFCYVIVLCWIQLKVLSYHRRDVGVDARYFSNLPWLASCQMVSRIHTFKLKIDGEARDQSMPETEACGLRACWWEDGLLREGEGHKIPGPSWSFVSFSIGPLCPFSGTKYLMFLVNCKECTLAVFMSDVTL